MSAKKPEYAYCVYYAKRDNEEYEVHARRVRTSDLLGFIELEDFIFPRKSTLIIQPDGEKVEKEFKDVNRTYIPIRDIRRIDRYPVTEKMSKSNLKVVEMRPRKSE